MSSADEEAEASPSHPNMDNEALEKENITESRSHHAEGSHHAELKSFMSPTFAQPKGYLQEYPLASQEHILQVFSTGTSLNRGIRSLPNALEPNFRRRLFEILVAEVKLDDSKQRPWTSPHLYNTGQAPYSPMLASAGYKPLAKVNPRSGDFTCAEYLPSEIDRAKIARRVEHLKSKLAYTSPQGFVVKACSVPPPGTNAFSEYPRLIEPQEEGQHVWLSHIHSPKDSPKGGDRPVTSPTSRPFISGGRVQHSSHLRGQVDVILRQLSDFIAKHWPESFRTVFEEDSGAIVICFDEIAAAEEGDLSSFMQALAKSSEPVIAGNQLVKSSQWGVRDDDTASRFYAFWPPWAKKRRC